MSRRVSTNGNKKIVKGGFMATRCHVCEKNGEAVHVFENHNFRDTKGRIVCERFLHKMRSNQCYKCDKVGHFADHCVVIVRKNDICDEAKSVVDGLDKKKAVSKKAGPPQKTSQNAFAALGDSSDSEEEPAPKKTSVKMMDWADYYSDDE